jgi:hypothetical protein
MFKYLLLSIAIFGTAIVLPELAVAAPLNSLAKMSSSQIEASLPRAHPAEYYQYAQRLFNQGRRDDAVFWFYVGQLRYRFHLATNPTLPEDGDPAVFAALNDTIGKEINEYAGGDPVTWVAAIDRALLWDKNSPNYFTSKERHHQKYDGIRAGLVKLRQTIQSQAQEIRTERTKVGLPNR